MATFKFSLEKILIYRTRLEDEAKAELGRLNRGLLLEKQRLELLQRDLEEKEVTLSRTGFDKSGERWLLENYIKALRQDIGQSILNVKKLEARIEKALEHVINCSKEKKVLEKLKEKHEKQFKQDEHYKEQREFDEITSIRHQALSY